MKFSYFIIFITFYSALSQHENEQQKDLKLLISIDPKYQMALSAILQGIKDFGPSSKRLKISYELLSVEKEPNKTELCSNLLNFSVSSLIIEVRDRPHQGLNALKLIARSVGIPMLSGNLDHYPMELNEDWMNLDLKESQFLIQLQLPSISLLRSMVDIARFFGMSDGVIFYEDYSEQHFKCLMREASFNMSAIKLETTSIDAMAALIKDKKKARFLNYFIISNSRTINLFLEAFRANSMFRQPYRLVVISKDRGKIKCTFCKHGQLVVITPERTYHEYETSETKNNLTPTGNQIEYHYFYDLTLLLLTAFEQIVAAKRWETSRTSESCLIQPESFNEQSVPILEYLHQESMERIGRYGPFMIASDLEQNSKPQFIYQKISMKISQQNYRADKFIKKTLAFWENDYPSGSILFTSKLEDENEDEKNDEAMVVMLYPSPPYLIKRIVNGSSGPVYEGFLMELFEKIVSTLGDKMPPYRFEEASSGPAGLIELFDDFDIDNPTYTGLLKEMIESEMSGFALAAIELIESRELVVDFSEPIFDGVGIAVMMKKPERLSHAWRFITVLESGVWLSVMGAYFFTSLLLAIFDRYSPYSYRNRPEKYANDEDIKIFTPKESLWFCFLSLTPQGGGDAPKCISGRLVAVIWWLLGFIFTASYTANLAAFLTVSRLDFRVDNMDLLSKQYKIRYAPVEFSATDLYFTEMAYVEDKYYEIWKNLSLSDDLSDEERADLAVWEYPISDIYTKIKAQMMEAQKPKTLEEGVRRVRASNSTDNAFALLTTSLDVEYFTHRYCDLFKAGEDFGFHPLALPITKGSPHDIKRLIDPIIKDLKDNGFIENLRVKYWYKDIRRSSCPEYRILSNGLTLYNTYGMFIVLGIGVFFTLVVLNIENWSITRRKRKGAPNSVR